MVCDRDLSVQVLVDGAGESECFVIYDEPLTL